MKRFLLLLLLLTGCAEPAQKIIEVGKPIEVYFCPGDDCGKALANAIQEAKTSIHCAFYDLDLPELIKVLKTKGRNSDVKLVIDADNVVAELRGLSYKVDDDNQLMHNKFCIIDSRIITTGSFNPTINGNTKNNNNLIILHSRYLAAHFEEEFEELWKGEFSGGKQSSIEMEYNRKQIDVYFCPEDNCKEHLINEILDAKNSIYFMLFTLTDEEVADAILYSQVKDIKGVMENFQAGGRYSQFERLKGFGIEVEKDKNPAFLHHKVFILDNETTITGSYNPTSAGTNKNDENMIIIRSRKVAGQYLEEFKKVSE
jgi:phosphatidylserine/phosphatidylglycerophosphate/cardiolipin synthase-like enzyme